MASSRSLALLSLLVALALANHASAATCDSEGCADAAPDGSDGGGGDVMSLLQPAMATKLVVGDNPNAIKYPSPTDFKVSAMVAEFVAMFLFVVIGCGSAMGIAKEPGSAWVLQVSLTFGFAITALAYSIGTYSGGQINCAVTLGAVLAGNCSVMQGLGNVAGQLLGSLVGATVLTWIYPKGKDLTGGLGTNGIGEGWSTFGAFIGEVLMTFLLVFVVLQTAVDPATESNRALACVAIGLAVFLAHSVLIPIDGCSINPTRSFGPAVVASICYDGVTPFKDFWVFVLGPLTGAAGAAGVYALFTSV